MINIVVMVPKSPTLELKCRPSATVLTLKTKIFEACGLFDCFYKLHCDGVELDNDTKMLNDYGIKDGSIIRLTHWNDPGLFGEKKKFLKLDFY